MLRNRYRFAVQFLKEDGAAFAQKPVDIDWEPVVEWMAFAAQRKSLRPVTRQGGLTTIEPIPHSTAGLPYCEGFRAVRTADGEPETSHDFPFSFFRRLAVAGSQELVKEGKLEAGERFLYRVAAFPQEQPVPAKPASSFRLTEVEVPLAFNPCSLSALGSRSVAIGESHAEDIPVFFRQEVIDEASAQTEAAGGVETGGILLGHLYRDEAGSEIAIIVSAQIPARHAEQAQMQLTFTPETWAAVRAAIALRTDECMQLGWWHSHPVKHWCQCEAPRRLNCPLAHTFFSSEDTDLHRTIFPRAFNVALVVTNLDSGPQHAVFGWRHAMVQQRSFNILKDDPALHATMEGHSTPAPL